MIIKPRQSRKVEEMIGRVVGRLTVVSFSGYGLRSDGKRRAVYRCRCECGEVAMVWGHYLQSNRTKSCGCLRREKGQQKWSKLLESWHGK